MKLSKKLQRKASRLMPNGLTDSIFVNNARGSHIWDVDGNEYIDYKLGWGPIILAIRIARAYTKKDKVLKFEGHYHGAHDYTLFSVEPSSRTAPAQQEPDSLGIPSALKKLLIINQWNDFHSVEKTIKKAGDNIAAIITEPIMANAAVIPPLKGYLDFLREICEKNDIVLIFDEVKTGFRVSKGEAQQLFGVKPHITTFTKALGNGYPISAVVGLAEIMQKYATEEVIAQSTYGRNLVSLAAADATLDEIK
jgi:glutamate-1-semialdehyde 2,1-aminomutase